MLFPFFLRIKARFLEFTKAEAEGVLCAILQSVNSGVAHTTRAVYTFEQFTKDVYLPFSVLRRVHSNLVVSRQRLEKAKGIELVRLNREPGHGCGTGCSFVDAVDEDTIKKYIESQKWDDDG